MEVRSEVWVIKVRSTIKMKVGIFKNQGFFVLEINAKVTKVNILIIFFPLKKVLVTNEILIFLLN